MYSCYNCGYIFDDNIEIFRSSVCPECNKDLKVCRNCTFYNPGSHWDCRETINEPVYEKESANFCSFFKMNKSVKNENGKTKKDDARENFKKLFGNG